MKARQTLTQLARDAGVHPVSDRQPCLPAPTQPVIIASHEDHAAARQLLVEQRVNDPDYRDPGKQLKRIFKSSREKEKLTDPNQWEFSQDELDCALSSAIDKPTTSPGLIQAFLNLGAKVNFIETTNKKNKTGKQPPVQDRRRSTVLQRAATVRRADSVNLLAASGADQTTLDEGLKAALSANNHPCVQELLRHGADINKCPNALADAVRANDQNFIRLLLRAPKALRLEILSSCLPAAIQQKSEPIISLLVGHGADPNFNDASALTMAISQREYRLAVALVAGTIPLAPTSLQIAFETAMRLSAAQDLYHFVQLLLCCGLSSNDPRLKALLIAAAQRNDLAMAEMLISHEVPTDLNESECLRIAISKSHWQLTRAILSTSIPPVHASGALDAVPADAPSADRLHIIGALVSKGANGHPLERWLIRAVEDGDSTLMDLLLNAGAPLERGSNRAIQAAVARKDIRSLKSLLSSRPSPHAVAQVFPLIRSGYTPAERLETVQILLENGARGEEVDQALIDAVADTSSSRDIGLITALVRGGASVDHDSGKALRLAVTQADLPTLRLLCSSDPSDDSKSAAMPLIFDVNGDKRPQTSAMLELLLPAGVVDGSAKETLQIAIKGGSGNLDIISRLVASNPRVLGHGFQHAIALDNLPQKEPVLTFLLGMGISQEALDQALVSETRRYSRTHDAKIVKLLLKHGSSINHNGGEAFVFAVASGDSSFVKLLLGGRDDPWQSATTAAFQSLFDETRIRKNANRMESGPNVIAHELLSRGVDQSAIDLALRTLLDPASGAQEIHGTVDLLLDHSANVNGANGVCFVFAAKRLDKPLFEKLLAHQPNFTAMLPSLLGAGIEEELLLQLVEAAINHGCTSEHLDLSHPPSLVMAIQRYPRSESLIKILLDHGCNPNSFVSGVVDQAVGEEAVTALTWALAQPQKAVSSSVIVALLKAGASSTRASPVSEISPIALAAREGRGDVVKLLLTYDADASIRDKYDRSALFYASSFSTSSVIEELAPFALKNDGSLHEAARSLQLESAVTLIKHGHDPNFPSRLHAGRNALGELCLNAKPKDSIQRSKARQLIRLFLENGANPLFKARNEKSSVIFALDNTFDPLRVSEALLETDIWQQLNDEKHMFRDSKGLWYSPLSYVELIPSPSRAPQKQQLIDLLRDKGCEPKYYSETEDQPPGAIGMPPRIARLADRQKEHVLALKLAKQASEHARMLEESAHLDIVRRKKEQQEADMAAASAAAAHTQALDQQKHSFDMQRVREAERMKRAEKAAWHSLLTQQEHESATQRAQIEERKASAALMAESRMVDVRKGEVEHRVGVERKALKEKEEHMGRNMKMQMQIQDRVDESTKLHAGLRQDRKALEWGTVD